jgi:hypothetical protein
MRFLLYPGPPSGHFPRFFKLTFGALWLVAGLFLFGIPTLTAFAQNQAPLHPEKPIILPEANRPPDANDQMKMRDAQTKKKNFDAANAERLKQMMQAADIMETMAIALKVEVDKSGSGTLSPEAIRKAETIEKLAHIVKERMKMTMATN